MGSIKPEQFQIHKVHMDSTGQRGQQLADSAPAERAAMSLTITVPGTGFLLPPSLLSSYLSLSSSSLSPSLSLFLLPSFLSIFC